MALPRLETDLNNVQTLPNQPRAIDGYTPEVIKALIDKAPNDIKDYLVNTLLPYLEGTAGAENIGLPETISGSGANVKARVEWLRTQINNTVLGQIPDGSLTDDKLSNEEGQLKSVVNEHLAENAKHVPHLGTTTNAGNVYSVTSAEVIDDNDKFSVKFNAIATGTATLNISSDGTARTLKKPDGSDFKPKSGIYSFIRDGVNFQLLGEGGEYGTATAGDVRSTKTVGTENGIEQGTLDLSLLLPENLLDGVTIDDVLGTLKPGYFASGTFTSGASADSAKTVSGIPFRPDVFIVALSDMTNTYGDVIVLMDDNSDINSDFVFKTSGDSYSGVRAYATACQMLAYNAGSYAISSSSASFYTKYASKNYKWWAWKAK